MNFVDSQLPKPPYPKFSQFIYALNNHELRLSSYDEDENIDQNLAFVSFKSGRGKSRGRARGHGRGAGPRSSTFNSNSRGPIQSAIKTHNTFNPDSNFQSSTKRDSSQVSGCQNFHNSKTNNFRKNQNFISQVQSTNAYTSNDQTQILCHICGKPNHTAAKRWYRYDFSQTKKEIPQAIAAIIKIKSLILINISTPGPQLI